MQNKPVKTPPPASEQTGVIQKAGEILSHLGAQIVDVKDKVADVAVKEFQVIKKAVKKKLAKKKKIPSDRTKKALPGKIAKKAAPKKVTKKLTGKKSAKKKALPAKGKTKFVRKAKKAAKKSASNRLKK